MREPIVDGNVERVVTRVFALAGDPRAGATQKRVWSVARALADCDRPGDLNQSLMELGATVCAPVAPRCLVCPARPWCAAARAGEPERYPEKRAKAAPREERWWALVAVGPDNGAWLATAGPGRWEGMLVPPMARVADGEEVPGAEAVREAVEASGLRCGGVRASGAVRHVLTHAAMAITVFRAEAVTVPASGGRTARAGDLAALAVPKVTRALLRAAGVE